ncbi:MAG: hypothetical protein ABL894_05330 [Hyphomicrobium sp.]
MKTRVIFTILLASAFAMPVQSAQAGPLKDSFEIVKFGAKFNAVLLKGAAKGAASTAKVGIKANAILARCAAKKALGQAC